MDQKKHNLVRSVSYSHQEPFLVSTETGGKCQVIATIIEDMETKIFNCEVNVFMLETVKFYSKKYEFASLKTALNWIDKVFAVFEPFGPPEMLYLPEWSDPEEAEKAINKWTDGLFDLGWKNQLTKC